MINREFYFILEAPFRRRSVLLGTIDLHWLQQGFLAHATNATLMYSLSQPSLPSNALFRIIEFRWFYKGLSITVRFGSRRRGPSPFYGGSAEASLKNPKEL